MAARYFFDTSALTKLYHPETGSPRVVEVVRAGGSEVRISSLAVLELQSAFAVRVRMQSIDEATAEGAMLNVLQDVATGVIVPAKIEQDHLDFAQHLVARHGYRRRLRSLDALQLAVALDLRAQSRVDVFAAADKALIEVARLEGLAVENPEDYS